MTSLRVTGEGFRVDRGWTAAEFERFRSQILSRSGDPVKRWHHRVVIEDAAGRRLETPGDYRCAEWLAALDARGLPHDLRGKTVLDVGCNAGFYSFVAMARGAASVTGIDSDPYFLAQAELVREIVDLPAAFERMDVRDLDPSVGTFDVVLCTGLLYHLQDPMAALNRLCAVTRELLYIESELLTDEDLTGHAWFIERTYLDDPTNWWIFGPGCLERMARAAGFSDVAFQGFLWVPPPGTATPEGFLRQGRGAIVCRK